MSSRTCRWTLSACLIVAGCLPGRRFEEVAPGVGVPRQSIDDYAEKHGITRDEAKRRITAEVTASDATDPEATAVNALEVVTGQNLGSQQPR